MSSLLVLNDVCKRYGAQTLFDKLSFSVSAKDRVGVLGPNGAGKSSLLKLMMGLEDLDSGSIVKARDLRISYLAQTTDFELNVTPLELTRAAARTSSISEAEQEALARTSMGSLQIDFEDIPIENLSGGQKKRVQIAVALCEQPDLLLLDEPTNHLDIQAIQNLESLLVRSSFAWIVVSHDRWFLENSVKRIVEVNRCYQSGTLESEGGYGKYLEKKQHSLATAEKQLDSLKNKVRTEQAWLRQGAKARSTKSKHRTSGAYQLMDSLSLVRARTATKSLELGFQFSERKTKRLLELSNVSKSFDSLEVIKNLSIKILAGEAIGVLGRNGSGKTTFLKLIVSELAPDSGTIKTAANVSIAYFSQIDNSIEIDQPLKNVLAGDSDSVVYQDRSIHVATWAKRFQFQFEQLHQPFSSLSGGEKARARIAKLLLEKAEVLVLDEPTNDLDIETLEVLEESLLSFNGAILLVTHDRFMINRVCTKFLGFDGSGYAVEYADYSQWERGGDPQGKNSEPVDPANQKERQRPRSKKLGYMEQREYDGMEQLIEETEGLLEEVKGEMATEAVQSDAEKLTECCERLNQLQKKVDCLYARWQELEEKQS